MILYDVSLDFDIDVDVMATNRPELELKDLVDRPTSTGSSLSTSFSLSKIPESVHSKETLVRNESEHDSKDVEVAGNQPLVASTEEIALQALHIDDDPSLNPWTFRMYFLGRWRRR